MRGRRSTRAQLLAGDGPLAKVPALATFAVVIGLFAAAIAIRGTVGTALLGLLAVAVGVLLAATWRVLPASARVGRVLVLAVLVAVAVTMATAQ